MPFPSGRCKTCRARHVKCDENRPICAQCSKSARACTWDEDESGGHFFRDENEFASSRAKRPRGGARRPATEAFSQGKALSTLAAGASASPQPASASLGIYVQPSEPIEARALDKLLNSFIDIEERVDGDVWGFLHQYRSDFFPLRTHATFAPAVLAYAMAHFGRTKHDANVIAASRKYYSQALINTSQAVQSESTAVEDEVALTALLLSGYEDQLGHFDCVKLRSQGFSHLEGITALMKARERQGKSSERSLSLNQFIRRRVIRASVSHGVTVTLSIQDGQLHDSDPVCEALYRCLVGVASVRGTALSILREVACSPPHERRSHLPRLRLMITAILAVDADLEAWTLCLPTEWHYQTREVSDVQYDYCFSSGVFYSTTYHYFVEEPLHLLWNHYRAARLITLGLLSKVAGIDAGINQMMANEYGFDFDTNVETMQTLVEDIAATIPIHFDAVAHPPRTREELIQRTAVSTAFRMTWPLIIASAILEIPAPLRDWIKGVLRLVSQIAGSAVLEMLSGMDLHKHLAVYPQSR